MLKFNLKSTLLIILCIFCYALYGQNNEKTDLSEKEKELQAPEKVEVKPVARDQEIGTRLTNILEATGWFTDPQIEVNEGVVFLHGQTKKEEYKKWAGDLSRKTEDVAAVVNQIEVKPSIWDYSQAWESILTIWRRIVQALPSIIFSLIILTIAWFAAHLVASFTRFSLRNRFKSPLLRDVVAKLVGFVVFLIGMYIVFEVAGLTAVALTIVGGTGILGIILGIAFRDITENILASIFLSIQNPFRKGDLIEIQGITGYVQRLTMRATVLLSLEGNHVQIPNATIYKEKILNFTSNPKRREDFIVGIGYESSIPKAQEIALNVLKGHPAILKTPEPWALVDSLGKAVVNLRIYFWFDGQEHSWLKVRSSVIRLIKKAFQDGEISMPDDARERIFPEGISVEMVEAKHEPPPKRLEIETDSISTAGESGLGNESKEIQDEAATARSPEEGENLLESNDSSE